MNRNIAYRILALAGICLLSACAPIEPLEYRQRPDMEEIAKILDCPAGRTPACVERINRPYQCYCADELALEMIFEPYKYE